MTDDALFTAAAAAREKWPGIALSDDDFAAAVRARDRDRELRLTDLFLATACAKGDPVALAAFDAELLGDLPGMLAHLAPTPDLLAETRATLRAKLFAGGRPRILDYAATADLHSWLRVVAARVAIDLLRRSGRELATDDAVIERLADDTGFATDPELAFLQASSRAAVAAAFADAVASLTSKQRNILRYQLIDRLTVDQIGALYGIHRATAARWVDRARITLVERTRELLRARLGITDSELDSLVQLVRSRMDLSLSRLLHCSKQ